MQTYRLALSLRSGGSSAELQAARGFDDSLALLGRRSSRPLFVPWSAASRESFEDVRMHWTAARWLAAAPPADLRPEATPSAAGGPFRGGHRGADRAMDHDPARIPAGTGRPGHHQRRGHVLHGLPVRAQSRGAPAAGLAQVQAGDFATRVEVDTRDEFGELAAGFNDMAQTLQSLYGGLEDKVREKTLRLELKRRRLADLYEVSAFVAEATSAALAQGFAHVRRIAEADAAAVRWCDDAHQRYLMLAHDRLPQSWRWRPAWKPPPASAVPPRPRPRVFPILADSSRAWATAAGPASPAWCRCRCACTRRCWRR